ncbi:terminase small subunit [Loktanella sp. TSTF-M6]|uniref:Terminase small subunit n=1 Tax=Loktanella gaetbuli TaxID=2881335 RepID=A0ABS8BTF6_9RHOB|nr:terminase small subunit [Loktanella gaetbuli]MCB5199030.1 terminase small subunit [Loktanella gaetbuli]
MVQVVLADGTELDVDAFPLPDGVDDGVLNRGQLAEALRVSEPSITSWIRDGMPVLSQGGNGQAYEFQLSHCFAWRMWRLDQQRQTKQRGDAIAQQMALAFLNLDEAGADEQSTMTAKDVADWADADYRRNKAAELRGDLVRADRVRDVFEQMLVDVRTSLSTIPDFAEQEFGLTADQAASLQDRCDAILIEMGLIIRRNNLGDGTVHQMTGKGGKAETS